MSAIRIVTGKEGIPLMIRDVEPFFTERWSDAETGFEYVDEYYLVFDFREGLFVEIVQRLIGGGEFSWEVPLDQIGEEALINPSLAETVGRSPVTDKCTQPESLGGAAVV
jgi:hypothetical protein